MLAARGHQISIYVGLLAVVALILLNGFFVAGEFSLVAVERSRIERLAQEGDKRSRRILTSLHNLAFELSGAQLGITATSLVLGAVAEPTIARLLAPLIDGLPFVPAESAQAVSLSLALALAVGTQMVIGELVPKNYAIARPYRSAVVFGIPMQLVNRVQRPLILFLNGAANWTVRRLGIEPREELAGVRSMEELQLMVHTSGKAGRLAGGEMELLTRAISFTGKVAADAMVPRGAVTGLRRSDSIAELRRLSRETGHSRFPVYGTDLDDIVGVVHVKDSLGVPAEQRSARPVAGITQSVLEVAPTRPLVALLADLQRQGRGLAVVVDEHGGTAGIVTVEDLLEEIFGEITDEHDPEPVSDVSGQGVGTLSGLLHRHEVEEQIGFAWPEGRYRTLGGFLVAVLGRFPLPGEVIRVGDWAFEIAAMDGHRVDRVVVHPGRPTSFGEGDE
ncbi:MAG: hemolysin family protein [Actinomycetota bacterium]